MTTLLVILALAAAFWCGLRVEAWSARQLAAEEESAGAYWHKQFLELQKRYFDLIWEVHTKFPGEGRHQTAKRYIMQQERGVTAAGEKILNG